MTIKTLLLISPIALIPSCAELTQITESLDNATRVLDGTKASEVFKSPVQSVSLQRKKLEATGESVGLFYIKNNSNTVWNSSYIEGSGNSYEKSYQLRLRDAQTKLNSLNSKVKGNPYYITVGGY